jgi:hypothetical protein
VTNEAFDALRQRPHYSRCKLGPARWFWCAWATYPGDFDEYLNPTASGYAPTADAADAAARGAVPGDPITYPTKAAAEIHRMRVHAGARRQRPSTATDATALMLVYRHGYCDQGGCPDCMHSTPHRVVRMTPRWLYVERDLYRGPEFRRHDGPVTCYRIDRVVLERDGEVWSQAARDCFYLRPHDRPARPAPPCLAALGLTLAATEGDVRRAFRRQARTAHPDAGGTADAFRDLRTCYEEALRVVGADGRVGAA